MTSTPVASPMDIRRITVAKLPGRAPETKCRLLDYRRQSHRMQNWLAMLGPAQDPDDRAGDDDDPEPLARIETLADCEESGGDPEDRHEVERSRGAGRRDAAQSREIQPTREA